MAKSLKELLAGADEFGLCDGLFTRIIEYHGDDIDVSAISEEERVVLLVWYASGIIENGGFRYLFEGDLKGDPHFALTAEAFRATGCEKAAEAVRNTLALFPDSRPPADVDERLQYYLKRIKDWPTDVDMQFFDAKHDLKNCLANYVRSHADAFRHVDSARVKRPPKKRAIPTDAAPHQKASGLSLADLPHWARVAFAARCAQQVFPLLAQHWPGVPAKHSNAVRLAIDLAEQSASEGRALEGLEDAVLHALVAAGAALASRPEFAQGQSRPVDAYSGTIASFVAKAAEKAAESARADAEDSLLAATDAWNIATNAAASAEETGVADELQEDFSKLHRAAARGRWTDCTKIPSGIWSML